MPVILVSMINTGARSAMRTTGGLTGGLADCDPRTTRPRRAPDATTPTRPPRRGHCPYPLPAAPRPVRAVRAARVSAADAARPITGPSGGTPSGCGAAAGGVAGGEMAGRATVAAPSGLVVGPVFGMTAYAHSGGDGT